MDLSSLTLPSLSQPGQKNTSRKLERSEVKNYLATHDVYQRAGLVLPKIIELSPTIDAADVISASNNDSIRLAVIPAIIDIETALAEDYAVVVSIELYEQLPNNGSMLNLPDPTKAIIDIIQIVLVGYDRENQFFLALTEDNKLFTIAYNYVGNELAAFDLWAIVR